MAGCVGTILLVTSIAHLCAAAAWLGALPALRLALKNIPLEQARSLAERFSPIGVACVITLMLTAAVQYAVLIGKPAALLNSAYGLTAFVKILLLAGLVVLAARNRTRFTPGLPATRPQLLRSIDVEIALGLLALLAAGLLLQLEPPTMTGMG
jgi:putative copper resistance protein D